MPPMNDDDRERGRFREREPEGGWPEYRLLLMREIDRLNEGWKDCVEKLNDVDREITIIKAKSAVWGAIIALIVSTAVAVISALISRGP